MKLVWIIIVIAFVGFIGGRYVFSKDRLPEVIRNIFLTGWEFILVGVALGPSGLELISVERLEVLNPFIALGLGWAGLIFGVQMSRKDLLKVDSSILKLMMIQGTAVWAGVLMASFLLFYLFTNLSWGETFTMSFVIAAAASISSPTALSLMAPSLHRSRLGAIRSLRIIATLDVGPAIIGLGVLFCFFSAENYADFSLNRGLAFLSISLLMGGALALFFRIFGRQSYHKDEDLTVLIGFLVFIAGIAYYLRLSPLFLSFVVGVVLANTLKPDDRMFTMLFSTEKPFYVILLIITGLALPKVSLLIVVTTIFIVALRLWLKVYTMERKGTLFYEDHKTHGRHAGVALVAQGALAPAIGLNYLLIYPGEGPTIAFAVIAIGMIINEILAPFLIRDALGDKAE